jgi:hypothetical protein
MKRTKYHRRPERFLPFEGKWGIVMNLVVERFVGIDRSTEKGLYALRFFVRSGRVWLLTNQILKGDFNGERSSQVVQ